MHCCHVSHGGAAPPRPGTTMSSLDRGDDSAPCGLKTFESISQKFKKKVVDTTRRRVDERGERKGTHGGVKLGGARTVGACVIDTDHCQNNRPMSWCGMALWEGVQSNCNDSGAGQNSPPCQVDRDNNEALQKRLSDNLGAVDSPDSDESEPSDDVERKDQKPIHGVSSVRSAWLSAAMAWRQKNMPSASELKKRKAEVSQRISEAARKRTSQQKPHVFGPSNYDKYALDPEGMAIQVPPRPAQDAPEADWQMYFRLYHSSRISQASSFVQVLRAFNIPCGDPQKIKIAYMQAVRMYHPDSNSKSRCWSTPRQRAEAEEIMKLINQRKPDDFNLK
jgi:hypothetical protein